MPAICETGARHTAELTPNSWGDPPHTQPTAHHSPWQAPAAVPSSGDAGLGARGWLCSGRTARPLHCRGVTLHGADGERREP